MVHWDSMQHVSLAVLGGMSMILRTLKKTLELKEISHRVMLGTETWKQLHMHIDETSLTATPHKMSTGIYSRAMCF